jgi:hypothetical protein
MTKRRRSQIAVSALLSILAVRAVLADSNLPPAARILDPDVNTYTSPYPTVSPDGKWVAYVAYGFVCICNVTDPAPRKILEVPNSWTWSHFTVPHGKSLSDSSFGILAKNLTKEQHDRLLSEVTKTIYGFNWTYDSSGFVFCVESTDKDHKITAYDTYLANVDGKLTKLIHNDSNAKTCVVSCGIPSRDHTFLVSAPEFGINEDYRPLIWRLKDNKPQATPFLYLTPCATSGHWLAIEKDSRQLVITDEKFDVVKRFDEFQQGRTFGFKLDWSPDERFIIWRNQIGFDYYSNWDGFWQNLDTAEKRPLEGQYMDEQIEFTGRGGEFFRCGIDGIPSKHVSGTQRTGAHLTIVPGDTKSPPRDLWRITVDPKDFKQIPMFNQPDFASIHASSDANLFAVRIPRTPVGSSELIWTLFDREGHQWRSPGNGHIYNISPYNVVGFANADRLIVAYDEKQLIAVPLKSIMTSDNQVP